MENNEIIQSSEVKKHKKKSPLPRFRLSTIIIWTVFIVVVVLSFLTNSQSQRINNEIILIAAADQLGRDITDLTKTDYTKITRLDLSESAVTNIRLLKKIPNLHDLDLSNTPLQINKTPQWKIILARWHILKINNRDTIDLSPLKKLKNLHRLNLSNASIKSVKPLAYLTNLGDLELSTIETSDFKFLKGLSNLWRLNLSSCQISDIEPLKNLKNLMILEANYTQISDIEPLNTRKCPISRL
jgi:Leucine-rich repeat (LRR) protein